MEERMTDWIINYLKHKDIFRKAIQNIEKKDDHVLITYKDSREIALIIAHLDNADDVIARISRHTERSVLLVTLNNRKNIDQLAAHWKRFAEHKTLKVFFINPEADTEQKWIIVPYTHSRIADAASLKAGLLSMAANVPFID